jgi:hypothetical protein
MSAYHGFDPAVAADVGCNAAVIYQNIKFWCAKNAANEKNEHEANYYTYNSVSAFCELFSYLSAKQIRTALEKLEERGYIGSACLNKSAYDRTKWYCDLRRVDLPIAANEVAHSGEPIPDINTDHKQTLVAQKRDVSARLVRDEVWTLWPLTGRRRSSQKKSLAAITSLLKDYSPQGIVEGVKAYLASDDAKRGDGQFVPGLDRWLRDEKFAEWIQADKPEGTDWRGELILYRDYGRWRPEGPTPGKPGCRAPEALLIDLGFNLETDDD